MTRQSGRVEARPHESGPHPAPNGTSVDVEPLKFDGVASGDARVGHPCAELMRRDAIGPCNKVSRPANRASTALRIVDLLRSILETDSFQVSNNAEYPAA